MATLYHEQEEYGGHGKRSWMFRDDYSKSIREAWIDKEVVMPIYTYYCYGCNSDVEISRSISERDNPIPCSKCGGALRRVIDFRGSVYAPTAGGMR